MRAVAWWRGVGSSRGDLQAGSAHDQNLVAYALSRGWEGLGGAAEGGAAPDWVEVRQHDFAKVLQRPAAAVPHLPPPRRRSAAGRHSAGDTAPPPPPPQAAKWYRMAAKQGHAAASLVLGVCHAKGRGVEQDWGRAFGLFLTAAQQGDVNGMFQTAWCHLNGKGAAQDLEQAAAWCGQAVEKGHANAAKMLGAPPRSGEAAPLRLWRVGRGGGGGA